MRAVNVVALLALVATATSREELSAEKAVEAAAPPSVCGSQCQNKYDVKVRVDSLSSLVFDAAHLWDVVQSIVSNEII